MKFNYTHGKTARYIVSLYKFNCNDKYYCHYYTDAERIFNSIISREKDGTCSIYDLRTNALKRHMNL